ncbi:MAG TPA: hypothetical protein VK988_00310 [Acidimicrobiales bacterium]|nr:hypothetical protein [Acidimicrobiales bacterium]
MQLTTDGHRPYLTVVEPLFGSDGIDFAMLHKLSGTTPKASGPTAPPSAPAPISGSSAASPTSA